MDIISDAEYVSGMAHSQGNDLRKLQEELKKLTKRVESLERKLRAKRI